MAAKPLRLLCVGKVRTPWWRDACLEYGRRIGRFRRLDVTEVRDADAGLPPERRKEVEGERLLAEIGAGEIAVVLDERGRETTSLELASALDRWDGRGRAVLVVGGPYGLSDAVRARADVLWSLSSLTLPHELARVVLLEQIYRAECVRNRVPYHH